MRLHQFKASVFLSVLCLLVSAGCGQLGSGGSDGSQPRPPLTSSRDPRQDLLNGLSRLKSAYPYRITEDLSYSQSPKPTTRLVEYAAADRIHYKMESYEGIEIGDWNYGFYEGKWIETGPHAKPAEGDIEEIITNHMMDVRTAGTENVNGIPCAVYTVRYEFTSKGEVGAGAGKIWIAIPDGLPRQLDSEIRMGNRTNKARRVYEYDASIKVEKPVP